MPNFHTVYVSELGVPFIEEAQEYESEHEAALDAARCFTPIPNDEGKYFVVPVIVKTHDGKSVILDSYDHITVMTPEELAEIKATEQRQRQGYQIVE